ncbi:OLC1v1004167C1 [Oldenlandia corymbosa var. corymbosa]|uniref:Pre-mRNA-splicing factor 38 n=1 Tax=Oldenlandia corymbosa var. corymbosa TaxID=529605 RepID=A0AAV1DCB5_OLDCO|nr:OLC1v1004167C1 [Oldenlandia corymbosa var. corymbosa]
MANRTDPRAKSIRGTDPQNLVEKILRTKIYQNTYWKQQCFGLTAETLVDKAMELDHVGGGTRNPTPFMCLVTKMLQIQPEKEIVVEFIKEEQYKYVRVLGAFYLRLTGTDVDVYRYLEPLYNDFRKLRQKLADGKFALTRVDVFVDELLTKDYSCDIVLPPIKKRWTLECLGSLEPRRSALEDDFDEELQKDEDDHQSENCLDIAKDYVRERDRDRRRRDHSHNKYKHRDYDRDSERKQELDRDRHQHHHRGDREYKRERELRRHSRSRSRSRDGKDNRHRRHASPSSRDETKKKKKEKKEKKDDGTDHPDPEISEANRLRASLGLKPLKL